MTSPFDDNRRAHRGGIFGGLRASFLTGLIIILPIGLTLWLIWTVVGWVDGFVLPLIPDTFNPEKYVGVNLRGLGLLIFFTFTVIVGWIGKGLIGRSLIRWGESLVKRTPVVRSIYVGIKQIAETVFSQVDRSFEKACLIEYPRRGIWAIGFISTSTRGEVASKAGCEDPMVSVFVPTTPNPTSGFLLFFPKADIRELDMSIEDAAKLVISAGLVYPDEFEPMKIND